MSWLRHIGLNVGANGFGVALALVTTPLMARLFPPESYGQYGLVASLTTLFVSGGLLGVPMALARERGVERCAPLVAAAVAFGAGLALLAALLLATASALGLFPLQFQLPAVALALWPPLIFAYALQSTGLAAGTAAGAFAALARGRAGDALIARAGTLVLGATWVPSVAVMMVGDLAGKLAQVWALGRDGRVRALWRAAGRLPPRGAVRTALESHGDFALYGNLAQLLPLVVPAALNGWVAWRLGVAAAGQWVLAHSILSLALSTIALGAAPVVFHRLVEVAEGAPAELPALALRVGASFALIGAAIVAPVVLWGPGLFAWAFGDRWQAAGELARWLGLAMAPAFSATVLISAFRVARRIRAWFAVQAATTAGFVAALLLLVDAADLRELGPQFALLWGLYQLALHGPIAWAVAVAAGGPTNPGEEKVG